MSIKSIINNRFPVLYQRLSNVNHEIRIRKNKAEWQKDHSHALKQMYSIMLGNELGIELDLENPKRYTEKIQLRKLNYREIHSKLSDKYQVRSWVASKVGEEYLIPLIGVWKKYDEIDFNKMPNKYVLKTNNASGTNIIVTDNNTMNRRLIKEKLDYWINFEYWYYMGYEMHYKDIEPLIIAEEYIKPDDGDSDLNDYKFLCFDGRVEYIWVDYGRYHNHKRATYDRNWNLMPFNQNAKFSKKENIREIDRPKNFDKMLEIAETLSAGFDHVRVDLYNSNGKIYFGEMTFTNGCGYIRLVPDEYDFILGEKWNFQP